MRRRPTERLREVRWQEDQTLDRRGADLPPPLGAPLGSFFSTAGTAPP
jgi:hypothetical protein